MMPRDLCATVGVNRSGRLVADSHLAGNHGSDVRDHSIGRLLRVLDAHLSTWSGDRARVSDLAAGLRIERRALDEYFDRVALACGFDWSSVLAQGGHLALGRQLAIASELGLRKVLGERPSLRCPLARSCTLLRHRDAKAFFVHLDATLRSELTRQLQREAVGVMQTEGIDTRDRLWVLRGDLFKLLHALLEVLVEAARLGFDNVSDDLLMFLELWVVVPEHRNRNTHAATQRSGQSNFSGVDRRAADQPAPH